DVFERASSQVTGHYAAQHPQLEGQLDRELFGVRQLSPISRVSVVSRSGSAVTLNAGAAHGLTAGSGWEVYAQGVKHSQDQGQEKESPRPLGRLELTGVGSISASAKIVEESAPSAIQAGAHALEREHHYNEMRLAVLVVVPPEYADAGAALVSRIGQSG